MDPIQTLLDALNVRNFLLTALIFVPFERLYTLRPSQLTLRRGLLTDLAYFFINPIPIIAGLAVVTALATDAVSRFVPVALTGAVAGQPLWLQAIEVLVIADIGQYCAHRAFHAFPILWKFHAVHHAPEEIDWLVAFHTHPVDYIATQAASMLPVFLLGFSDAAIAAFMFIFHWHSVLLHANTRLNWGPLNWLIASPQFHHWHHANEPQAYNRNFSATFPLIDMVGGTYLAATGQYPGRYGASTKVGRSYADQLLGPFVPKPRTRAGSSSEVSASESSAS